MKRRAVRLDLSQRTNSGEISNVLREEPWYIKEIAVAAWEIGHPGAMWANIQNGDRPIGVATHWPAEDPAVLGYSFFYPIAIQVTQSVAEAAIAGAYGAPGLISIRFVDHAIGSKSIKTIPEYGYGDYTLNLKIERIP